MSRTYTGIIFLVLLFVTVGIYVLYPFSGQKQEGFEDAAEAKALSDDGTEQIPGAPYQQIAKTAPRMWKDSSREPTTRERVREMTEDLRAFFSFEGNQLEDTSDPAVQLPLGTAKADLKVLESEAIFIERNPGLPPTITLKQIEDMEANLEGLRKRARSVEGFTGSTTGSTTGSSTGSTTGSTTDSTTTTECDFTKIATLADIKDLDNKVFTEIQRLSANGTNDPVIAARIKNLQTIRTGIKDIIGQVETGTMLEAEIPVYQCDARNFLKVLGADNQTKGIPAIFKSIGLSSLFPSGTDPETIKQVNRLIEQYGEKLLNGLSAGISLTTTLKYTSPNEAAAAVGIIKPVGYGPNADVPSDSTAEPIGYNMVASTAAASTAAANGGNYTLNVSAAAPASGFDWKKRTKEICAAVRRRGLDPADFGCLSSDEVSSTFDWRGQAKMVCTRLGSSYETGLPELVGCPDFTWPGWTSRQ